MNGGRFPRSLGIGVAVIVAAYVAWIGFIVWAIYTLVTWVVTK